MGLGEALRPNPITWYAPLGAAVAYFAVRADPVSSVTMAVPGLMMAFVFGRSGVSAMWGAVRLWRSA